MIIGERGPVQNYLFQDEDRHFFHVFHILFYLENEVKNVFKDCCEFFPIKTQDI